MNQIDLENYIPVHNRITKFYGDFPSGKILTQIVEHDRDTGFVVMKALIYRNIDDAEPSAIGHAFEERFAAESKVNKTSYIENCETSCVGRALALLGYDIKRGIASREEMEKVKRYQQVENEENLNRTSGKAAQSYDAPASERQIFALKKICEQRGLSESAVSLEYSSNKSELFNQLTKQQASEAIGHFGNGRKK